MNVDPFYGAWQYRLEKQRDSSAFWKLRWLVPYQARKAKEQIQREAPDD